VPEWIRVETAPSFYENGGPAFWKADKYPWTSYECGLGCQFLFVVGCLNFMIAAFVDKQ